MAQLQHTCALDEQGRFEDALKVYQSCTEQHPESADAWAALGALQRHLGQLEAAAASLSRALQLEPSRLDVIEQFGMSLQDQRRHEDASLAFERLLQLDPERPLTAGRLMHVKMLGADWTALGALYQRIATDIAAGRLAAEPFGLQGYCPAPATGALTTARPLTTLCSTGRVLGAMAAPAAWACAAVGNENGKAPETANTDRLHAARTSEVWRLKGRRRERIERQVLMPRDAAQPP